MSDRASASRTVCEHTYRHMDTYVYVYVYAMYEQCIYVYSYTSASLPPHCCSTLIANPSLAVPTKSGVPASSLSYSIIYYQIV
jgi:hypothetical protein